MATEELTGWPALEWAELVDRAGADRARAAPGLRAALAGRAVPGRARCAISTSRCRADRASRRAGAAPAPTLA